MANAQVYFPRGAVLDFRPMFERLQTSEMYRAHPMQLSEKGIRIDLPQTPLYVSHVTADFVAIEALELAELFQHKLTPEQHALLLNSDQRVEIWLMEDNAIDDVFNEWLICTELVSEMGPSVTLQPEVGEVW